MWMERSTSRALSLYSESANMSSMSDVENDVILDGKLT